MILLWFNLLCAVLVVGLAGLLMLARPDFPVRVRLAVGVIWCIVFGLAAFFLLGICEKLVTPWVLGLGDNVPVWPWMPRVYVIALSIAGMESLIWALVLVRPPKSRPPTSPGKPSSNYVAAQSRTYRTQRRWPV